MPKRCAPSWPRGSSRPAPTSDGRGIAHAGVLIRGDVVFEGEQGLETVAEVFDALEAQAGRGVQAVVDDILAGFARRAEVGVADVDDTINGDIGLSESGASGDTGDGSGDDFLEHVKSPMDLVQRLVDPSGVNLRGLVVGWRRVSHPGRDLQRLVLFTGCFVVSLQQPAEPLSQYAFPALFVLSGAGQALGFGWHFGLSADVC